MPRNKKKWYAIKSIDEKQVNLILTTWTECEKLVLHHKAVYKSFPTEEQAKEYLLNMTKEKQKTYIEKAEYGRKKRKELKTTKLIQVKVSNDIYEKFQEKLHLMKYDENDVIIDLIKDWCE